MAHNVDVLKWFRAWPGRKNNTLAERILQFRNIMTPINNLYREFGVLKLTDMHDFNIYCNVHTFPEAINDILCRNEQIHH